MPRAGTFKDVVEKAKEVLKVDPDKQNKKEFLKLVKEIRDGIPERYNQIELAEWLASPEVDWLVSISNRTDGKSYNYVHFCIELSKRLDIKFMLLSRTYMIRHAYMDFIFKLYQDLGMKTDKLNFKRSDDYVMIIDDGKIIGCISDLNNSTDLKYSSSFIKDFPIIIYDEFLALESDYLPYEYEKLKMIYETVDRNGVVPIIHSPKILLLGNAVNFSSPLLASLDLFNILETHEINTLKQYGKIVLEMRKNENANEVRNTRAFDSEKDAMTTGQFNFNHYMILSAEEFKKIRYEGQQATIKVSDREMIAIYYQKTNYGYNVVLSLESDPNQPYQFCVDIKDKKENVIFLKESFYGDNTRKFNQGFFKFKNSFSKQQLTTDNRFSSIKFLKVLATHEALYPETPNQKADKKEQIYQENYLEITRKNLFKRFLE